MNMIVLLKQVPDTAALIEIAEDQASIKTEDVKWVINPYDELAVEEAIRIRESQGKGKLTILSVGRESVMATIRTAMAMGADEGILINDPNVKVIDPLNTGKILAAALKTLDYDIILAGPRAVDDDSYLVPSAVAEYLGIPLIAMAVSQEISDGSIRCERTVQDGTVVVEAELPVVMTTQRGLNEPRHASLPNIMKAKKKPIEVKTLADFALSAADYGPNSLKTTIRSLAVPPKRKAGKIVDGPSVEEKAAYLVRLLREEATVL